jgi:hypothetical protein
MLKYFKKLFNLYFAIVLLIWGLVEGYSYFEGDALKNIFGIYWWFVFSIIPFLIAIVLTFYKNDDDTSGTPSTKVRSNTVGRDYVEGDVYNINVNGIPQPDVAGNIDDEEKDDSTKQRIDEPLLKPIIVTFSDRIQKTVSFSASIQVIPTEVSRIVANYGSFSQAQNLIIQIIESSVISFLEKYSLSEARMNRSRIEEEIINSVAANAKMIGFNISSLNIKEIK